MLQTFIDVTDDRQQTDRQTDAALCHKRDRHYGRLKIGVNVSQGRNSRRACNFQFKKVGVEVIEIIRDKAAQCSV